MPLILSAAGLAAVAFAFVTVNLFAQAMANLRFIERHGWEALRSGALVQLAELAGWGLLALLAYLLFKLCEVELVTRYFRWARGGPEVSGAGTDRRGEGDPRR